MKLLETKKVKVGDLEFPIRKTNRAYILFDELNKDTGLSGKNLRQQTSLLFYCMAKAGAKAENQEFNYTYEQFLDVIDDYPDDVLINFSAAIKSDQPDSKKK